MRAIQIDPKLKQLLPELVLGSLLCTVNIVEHHPVLEQELREVENGLGRLMKLEEISSHPAIHASRQGYKRCGKDPARYRLSSEALMRRVVKGEGLYRINNVVDLVNLISLKTGMSIGGYDDQCVDGEVVFAIGRDDEPYEAIGRGPLNIGNLPVFRDYKSAFGSPTSDSVRTSVTNRTTRFLMIIVGFAGMSLTEEALRLAEMLLQQYGNASAIERNIIV